MTKKAREENWARPMKRESALCPICQKLMYKEGCYFECFLHSLFEKDHNGKLKKVGGK